MNTMKSLNKRAGCIVYGLVVLISFSLLTFTVAKLNAKLEVHQDAHIVTSKVQIDSYSRMFETWLAERSKRIESIVYHGLTDKGDCDKGSCLRLLERSIAYKIDEFSTYSTRVEIKRLQYEEAFIKKGKPQIVIEQTDELNAGVRIEQRVIFNNFKVDAIYDAEQILNELFTASELNRLRALYLFNQYGDRVEIFGNHTSDSADAIQLNWLVDRISNSKMTADMSIGEGHFGDGRYVVWGDNLDSGFALVALLQKGTYDVFIRETKTLFFTVIFLLCSSLFFSLYGIYLLRRRLSAIAEHYQIELHREVASRTKSLYQMQVELNEANNELRRKADRDALTGLANRRRFMEIVKTLWCNKESKNAAVLMIDLDHFKKLNDNYGHVVGDACLIEVGQVLKNVRMSQPSVRAIGRFGGEEFIVLLTNVTKSETQRIADEIRVAIEDAAFGTSQSGGDLNLQVTASVGAAHIDNLDTAPFDYVMQEADIALYQAKEQGRNRVVLYDNTPQPISAMAY